MKKFISVMAAALLLVSCTSPANDNDSEDAVVAETSAEAAPETAEEEITFTAGGTSPYTGREIITHTYAYSLLTDEQKSIYDKLLNACLNFDEIVEFDGYHPDFSELEYIYKLIHNDEYRLFYTTNQFRYKPDFDKRVKEVALDYTIDRETALRMRERIGRTADTILSRLNENMSDFEIVQTIHDTIIDRCVYADSDNDNNIYGALVERRAKCQGYSKAFCYLCSLAGVSSLTVLGETDTEHMWNEAMIDGSYCHIDLTWDDPDGENGLNFIKYDYFGLTDEEIRSCRTIEGNEFELPVCSDTRNNYYVHNDLCADSVDNAKDIILQESKKNGVRCIQFKAADESVFGEITERLLHDDSKELIRLLHSSGNAGVTTVDYIINKRNYVVKLFY